MIVDNLDNDTHKVASPQEQQPKWVSTITTNTDGEIEVRFYYDDGLVYIR